MYVANSTTKAKQSCKVRPGAGARLALARSPARYSGVGSGKRDHHETRTGDAPSYRSYRYRHRVLLPDLTRRSSWSPADSSSVQTQPRHFPRTTDRADKRRRPDVTGCGHRLSADAGRGHPYPQYGTRPNPGPISGQARTADPRRSPAPSAAHCRSHRLRPARLDERCPFRPGSSPWIGPLSSAGR